MSIFGALDKLDWYIIRHHPLAWYWRVDYLLLTLTTTGFLALLFPSWFFAVLIYSFAAAHCWLNLTLGDADHLYDGNGIAPLVLGTLLAMIPVTLHARGNFEGEVGLAYWIFLTLYYHKLVLFGMRPRASGKSAFRWISGITVAVFAIAAVGFASFDPSPQDAQPENASTMRSVLYHPAAFITMDDALKSAGRSSSFMRSILPSPYGDYGKLDWIWILVATVAALVAGSLAVSAAGLFRRLIISPLLDFQLHKRLLLGPQRGDKSSEWAERVLLYSAVVPTVFFVVEGVVLANWHDQSHTVLDYVPGILAVLAFVLLQSRSLQPYLNDYRAQKEPNGSGLFS